MAATARVRPAIRRLAIAAAIVLTPIVAHQIWDYVEVRRLLREVEHIQASGGTLDERHAPGAWPYAEPGVESAGPYYLAAATLALGSRTGVALQPVRAWLSDPTSGTRASTELLEPIRAAVAKHKVALDLVDRATTLPYAGMPAGTEFSYRTGALSGLGSLMTARALVSAADGDGDAAVRSVLALLELRVPLADVWRLGGARDPFVDAVLSWSRPSADSLVELQRALEAEDQPRRRHARFERERARAFRFWRASYGDPIGAARSPDVLRTLVRPIEARRTRRTLERWRELFPLLDRPWAEQLHAVRRFRANDSAWQNWAEAEFGSLGLDSSLASDRCAVVAVALARYASARQGALPQGLADLVPEFLAAVPADPFGDAPLRYERNGSSYVVYSVGPDGTDDEGDLTTKQLPGSLRGVGALGSDVGLRVSLPPSATERQRPVEARPRRR